MMTNSPATPTQEQLLRTPGGFPMLVVSLVLLSAAPLALALTLPAAAGHVIALAFLISILGLISLRGFFTLQPNEARVLILFGHYRGTVRDSGFHWANPFYAGTAGRFRVRERGAPTHPPTYALAASPVRPDRAAVVVQQNVAAGQ